MKYDSLTIGIVGGGQLARMMFAASIPMGVDVRVFAGGTGEPAGRAITAVGNHNALDDLLPFAREVDVLTFEHEHVGADVLLQLAEQGVGIHPHPRALQYAQNKLSLRQLLAQAGVAQPQWREVHSLREVQNFASELGGRCVVKLPSGGYDGNGVCLWSGEGDARGGEAQDREAHGTGGQSDAAAAHPQASAADTLAKWLAERGGTLLVEEYVNFECEVAVQMAVSPSGQEAVYPPVVTVQKDGKCASVYAPAELLYPHLAPHLSEAQAIARAIAKHTGATGMLTVEMFYSTERGLLVNELAMRPHNSGHWSIEGTGCSQFEQHLRAVSGLALGPTEPLYPAVIMHNILGKDTSPKAFNAVWKAQNGVYLHSYAKQLRPGRKMGHLTACGASFAEAQSRADAALALLG